MNAAARGRIHCWEGGSLWIGAAAGDARLHEHHALQISLAFSGRVRFRTRSQGWRDFTAALIPPHLAHAFEVIAPFTAQIFLEPETIEGRALLDRFGTRAIVELPAGEVGRHAGPLRTLELSTASDRALEAATRTLITGLSGARRPAVLDRRIAGVLASLRRGELTMTLAEAAKHANLSPGRFRHLFVEQTGQSFRSHQLWLRLQRAIELLARGGKVTGAAHAAGFADGAHLARTFRRMMGIAPSFMDVTSR